MRTRHPAPQRQRLSGWPAAAAAAVLAAAVIGGTVLGVRGIDGHSGPAPLTGAATSGSPVSSVPATAETSPAVTATRPASTTPTPTAALGLPSGHPVAGTHLINLTLTDQVRAQLVTAYVTAMHYQPAWITGTKPGSVYYAYDTRDQAYLVWAGFEPSPSAPQQVGIGMQDGGYRTAFRRLSGQPWQKFNICDNTEFNALVGPHYGGC